MKEKSLDSGLMCLSVILTLSLTSLMMLGRFTTLGPSSLNCKIGWVLISKVISHSKIHSILQFSKK